MALTIVSLIIAINSLCVSIFALGYQIGKDIATKK